ncbi:type II toxin-antitoxin system Phd/YefM family antitoxin [Xylanimonas allomyrinae]|uniref:Type II toxin-antitoxin system Phd/YefM family antitoxin n=1 Tax=Xylanimonas allomyrinae TaxID=2509459 RepID=A0A4P6EYU9_9MICO|nr:type II toxin-antitoxin system Phd/YefM family antitoxin [Xylanimonas allomyrinae]QAY63238.1 type II toxin-antitoxin system Phd/YefM family antitoxin [Xylanimonas allomyrinae]
MSVTPVGIRRFRADLATYVDSDTPVAVQRHGHTVGFFIPVKVDLTAERAVFAAATAKLDALLADEDVEAALRDFEDLRASET